MHKKEASILFNILSNENIVKTLKMLYNSEYILRNELCNIIGVTNDEMVKIEKSLIDNELIKINDSKVIANKPLIDELMSFITTPCNCIKK